MTPTQPLAKFPVVATNRVEAAEYSISRSIADARIDKVENRGDFRLEMNAVDFECFKLVYNHFGTRTVLSAGQNLDHAIFVTGMGVPIALHVGGKRHLVTQSEAAILAPAKEVCIERPAHSEILYLRVSLADLRNHFETLTARHQRGALVFDPNVSVIKGPGALLKGLMDYLVNTLALNEQAVEMPLIRKSYNDVLMSAMLSLPHNKTGRLCEDRSTIAPAVVRRAEEYMRAHLEEPVTIPDLVHVCNCSRSVLFSAFRNARNYTPMEFLTEQRLLHAREQLLRFQPEASASAIALKSGFISYSWFSQVYRKRFHERPSDTLRKHR